MGKFVDEHIHRINYLSVEMDALYHQAALRLGLTDSAMLVLYHLYDSNGSCLLSDIYKQSGVSKQTVNSAIRNLEKDGIIRLEQKNGKMKIVHLTENGKKYVDKTVAYVFKAESAAYSTWTENEIEIYTHLMEKYVESFREQINTL